MHDTFSPQSYKVDFEYLLLFRFLFLLIMSRQGLVLKFAIELCSHFLKV